MRHEAVVTIMSILLLFLFLPTVQGQAAKFACTCPVTYLSRTKADATFRFSNGKTVVLCGYKNPDTKPATYSEFVLAVCGQRIIIGFWGALLNCRLQIRQDTLLVNRLEKLSNGKNFAYQENVWTTEKIYFNGEKAIKKLLVNRKIKNYNQSQIKSVVRSYETARGELDEQKMANQLLIAAISGDQHARRCFKAFKNKFGLLDSDFAEEYNGLVTMLMLWDSKQ